MPETQHLDAGPHPDPPALPTLRLLTCGSVDDGKSTLIGRLLYEQSLILDDQLAALERDSKKHGTDGDNIDFALLVDGLEAEREQGITIDVAYRYVSTPNRSFVIADTPGHEQYTRNMATGASCAELAILLVDARKGILTQTCRHAAIVSLTGIRHVVLAVNKIDLTGFDQARFEKITADFMAFAASLNFKTITPIPISARYGDNISQLSTNTPWYRGPALIDYLETMEAGEDRAGEPFRFLVQWVNRPHLDFRGFSGAIVSGALRRGDDIAVAGSGRLSRVARIVTADGDLDTAAAGDSVTLTLADELDIARGDILCDPRNRPEVSDQFAAHLIWMSESKLLPGRSYLMKAGTRTVPVSVTELKHRL
ncbi:MAG: GTP-binding protein, partial [Beijerinckiaceae bacterium]|nr:GTP-binding protein [Beijerinckiaceae bacterium]